MEEVDTQLTSGCTDLQQDGETVADGMGCCKSKSGQYNANSVEMDNYAQKDERSVKDVQDSAVNTESETERQQALQALRNVQTHDDYDDYGSDDVYDEAHSKYVYFWQSESVYSQWHKSDFYIDDIKFNCAEQYMMYAKAKLFEDEDTAKLILKASSPRKIKQLGRAVQGFVDEIWKYNCLDIVKTGNIAKFSNQKFQEEIFSTYPKLLVEASPYDKIWGIGLLEDDPGAWKESKWCGTNYLGYILTEVRNDLMIEHGKLAAEHRMNYVEKEKEKFRKPYELMLEILQASQIPTQKENQESHSKINKTSPKHNENPSKASTKGNDKSSSTSQTKETNSEDGKKGKQSYEKKKNEGSTKSLNQDVKNNEKSKYASEKGASICTSNEERPTDTHLHKDAEEAGDEWKVVGSNKAHQSNRHINSVHSNEESPQTGDGKKKKKKRRRKKSGQEGDRPEDRSSMSSAESSSIKSSMSSTESSIRSINEVKAEMKKNKLKENDDFEPHIPNSSTGDRKHIEMSKHKGNVIRTDSNTSSRSQSEDNSNNQDRKGQSRRQKKNAKKREQAEEKLK